MAKKPPLILSTTTFWDYPSQSFGKSEFGDKNYAGVTPAFIIWNLLKRYTRPKDLVLDPMAGSGTTLDVARELSRRFVGYDLQPTRPDIFRADARRLPVDDEKADFVFIDPPYSTHIRYSGKPECLGELHAGEKDYFAAMEKVIGEIYRVLKPDRYMGLYISDSFEKDEAFLPIGFDVFALLRKKFVPVDIVAVKRYNAKLDQGTWHDAAIEHNYFMRGFNYLFIMYKKGRGKASDRRLPEEVREEVRRRREHRERE